MTTTKTIVAIWRAIVAGASCNSFGIGQAIHILGQPMSGKSTTTFAGLPCAGRLIFLAGGSR